MAIREKLKLGDVLIKAGAILEEHLKKALEFQKSSGVPLGKALIQLKIITEEQLINSLSKQLNVPFLDMAGVKIEPAAVKKVRENIAKMHKLMPIAIKDGRLVIAMNNPLNIFAIDEVIIQSGMDVDVVIAMEQDIDDAIQQYYGVAASIQAAVKSVGKLEEKKEQAKIVVQAKGTAVADTTETPVAKLVEMILKQALDDGASDIHIEPTPEDVSIRYRIDGVLFEANRPPKSVESALISRIKVLANMDISETRAPQDGGLSAKFGEREIEFRVSSCPTIYGENMVLRILDRSRIMFKLSDMGLMGIQLTKFEDLLKKPYGVILVTGPTGSGKTTTLYASLAILNTPTKNIKTIEDPVEYRLPGVRQTQVNPKANITFANGLRSLMRQDPDVIMVGEIRDKETSEIAIQAALTGHLVLSTLHTNDAPGALSRLSDLGIEPFLLASSVVGIIAQRLVRKICSKCRVPHEPSEEELAGLFPGGNRKPVTLFKGEGCKACKRSGYHGRMGIYELLVVTDDVRLLVLEKSAPMAIRNLAKKTQGFTTLREDGIAKVLAGYTTFDELNRVTFAD
jgi:type IV pilus assembly protein PilB